MYNSKLKALTFSFDDGVTQDQRLIKLLDKYHLRSTFNINSARLDQAKILLVGDVTVSHCKPRPCEIKAIYQNHEVAGHTLSHPCLTTRSDDEIVREVEQDRLALSRLCQYEVVGFAYPGGSQYVDDRVISAVRTRTGVKYARNACTSGSFDPPTDLFNVIPTASFLDGNILELAKEFIAISPHSPKLFFIYGHAYEPDGYSDGWERVEKLFSLISHKDDIFYGTNKECLLF